MLSTLLFVACVSAACAGPASSSTLGGKLDADPKDPKFQKLVEWTESFIDGQTNSLYSMKLFNIISATRQIVAGVNYEMKLEMAHTECPKSLAKNKDECEFDHGLPHVVCDVKIFDQPWTKTRRVEEFKCTDSVGSVGLTNSSPQTEPFMKKFEKFERKFAKTYTPEERLERLEIFKRNMAKIAELQKHERGTAKYGITRFADLSEEEFRRNYLGYRPELRKSEASLEQAEIPEIDIPESFDWRDHGAVTPVKNQGQCGSCWAFSVTGNVEGQWALKRGKLLELSEQELVDCDKLDEGCNGGLMENAYKAIVNLGGLETETEYPYDARGEACKFNKTGVRAVITGGVELPKNETAMAQWLVKNGPISIAINANAMQFYFGGVSHPWKVLCNPGGLDHGVLIVGYGVHRTRFTKRDVPYWIVKNSWGPGWGQKGYYLVYRGDGTCGVDQSASSATIL